MQISGIIEEFSDIDGIGGDYALEDVIALDSEIKQKIFKLYK